MLHDCVRYTLTFCRHTLKAVAAVATFDNKSLLAKVLLKTFSVSSIKRLICNINRDLESFNLYAFTFGKWMLFSGTDQEINLAVGTAEPRTKLE